MVLHKLWMKGLEEKVQGSKFKVEPIYKTDQIDQ